MPSPRSLIEDAAGWGRLFMGQAVAVVHSCTFLSAPAGRAQAPCGEFGLRTLPPRSVRSVQADALQIYRPNPTGF